MAVMVMDTMAMGARFRLHREEEEAKALIFERFFATWFLSHAAPEKKRSNVTHIFRSSFLLSFTNGLLCVFSHLWPFCP